MRKLLIILLSTTAIMANAANNEDVDTAQSNSTNSTSKSANKVNNKTAVKPADTKNYIATNSNAPWQQFENQYNIGYGASQGGLINGKQQTSGYNQQMFNLEVERLFNDSIWLDGNFNMVTGYSQENLGPLNGGNGSGEAFGQNPFMYGFNLKGGYAFQLVTNSLQIIPYAMFGRDSNLATSTVNANGSNNMTTDYFYSGGFGARLNYRINDTFMLYADQLYQYNWDNSGAIKTVQTDLYGKSYAATNYELTSTIGAKFNIWENLQLGVNGFYTYFQPQSNISGLMYTPNNIIGAMATIGLTY